MRENRMSSGKAGFNTGNSLFYRKAWRELLNNSVLDELKLQKVASIIRSTFFLFNLFSDMKSDYSMILI